MKDELSSNMSVSASQSQKMPVSELQEFCASHKLSAPEYQLVDQKGPPHCCTFVTAVSVKGVLATTGSGNSKQAAKHAAALNALQQIWQQPTLAASNHINHGLASQLERLSVDDGGDDNVNKESSDSNKSGETIYNPNLNPISQLQEVSAKRGWPPPVYEWQNSDVLQKPCFICRCTFYIDDEQCTTEGGARSKNGAKRIVAEKAMQMMLDKGLVKEFSMPNQVCDTQLPKIESKSLDKATVSREEMTLNRVPNSSEMLEFYKSLAENEDLVLMLTHENDQNVEVVFDIVVKKLRFVCQWSEFDREREYECLLSVHPQSKWDKKTESWKYLTSWGRSDHSMEEAKFRAVKMLLAIVKALVGVY